MKWGLLAGQDSPRESELLAVLRDLLEHDVHCVRDAASLGPVDCLVLGGSEGWAEEFVAGQGSAAETRQAVLAYARDGGLVLAIGAGFAAACSLGLLPGRLAPNKLDGFVCRMVAVRVENAANPWAQRAVVGDVWQLPLRTARGRLELDSDQVEQIERDGLVLLRYEEARDGPAGPVIDPVGSKHRIAALMSPGHNVLGIALHPENVVDASLVEPQWPGLESGRVLFESIVDWVESGVHHGVVESER